MCAASALFASSAEILCAPNAPGVLPPCHVGRSAQCLHDARRAARGKEDEDEQRLAGHDARGSAHHAGAHDARVVPDAWLRQAGNAHRAAAAPLRCPRWRGRDPREARRPASTRRWRVQDAQARLPRAAGGRRRLRHAGDLRRCAVQPLPPHRIGSSARGPRVPPGARGARQGLVRSQRWRAPKRPLDPRDRARVHPRARRRMPNFRVWCVFPDSAASLVVCARRLRGARALRRATTTSLRSSAPRRKSWASAASTTPSPPSSRR